MLEETKLMLDENEDSDKLCKPEDVADDNNQDAAGWYHYYNFPTWSGLICPVFFWKYH